VADDVQRGRLPADDCGTPRVVALALSELVGKPVRASLRDPTGPEAVISGVLRRVVGVDDPWLSASVQRLHFAADEQGTSIEIDCDEVAGVWWASPLHLVLHIDFADSTLRIEDDTEAARMLAIELLVGSALHASHPPVMRDRQLRWLIAYIERQHAARISSRANRWRLKRLLEFLDIYAADEHLDESDDIPF
jgi:hypothetical protein